MKKPNIIWIQTDEHRPDTLGCYGNEWAQTPHIDKLAKQGTVFSQCHCQSPVCVPSRASMLACMYPQEINVLRNRVGMKENILDPDLQTFPQLFAQAGYQTVNFGKWHTPVHPTWQECTQLEMFDNPFDIPTFRDKKAEKEYNVIRSLSSNKRILAGTWPEETSPSSVVTDQSLQWLKQHAQDTAPFLLRVSHLWPHSPVLCPPPWDSLHDPQKIPCPALNPGKFNNLSEYEQSFADADRGLDLSMDTWREIWACYNNLVSFIDFEVGRLLAAVKELD